jgi:hypothetical protein
MSQQKYTLDIISQHPDFRHKTLRKYFVDGVETIGAWGNEPFEIRFSNNTNKDVQVKISVDGTDVLSGDPASTTVGSTMWLVKRWSKLALKAWPENNNGGASFVFTSADNSVALHTHGDMSSRGIIAAAVFEEGHTEFIKVGEQHHHHHYYPWTNYYWDCYPYGIRLNNGTFSSGGGTKSASTLDSRSINAHDCDCSDSLSINNVSERATYSECSTNNASPEIKSLVSVGAGSYVNQNITYTKGLIKPVFAEAIRVRYLWWDDLKAKLESGNYAVKQPTGFPGDPPNKMINLQGTPRLDTKFPGSFRRAMEEQVLSRF